LNLTLLKKRCIGVLNMNHLLRSVLMGYTDMIVEGELPGESVKVKYGLTYSISVKALA